MSTITADPISLQAEDVIDEEVGDDINAANFFDGLKVKVSKGPVLQLMTLTLDRDGTKTAYDVEEFGYTLQDNRYDTASASRNVNLSENEIELSTSSLTGLSGGFLQPKAGDTILVSYVYKKLGKEPVHDTIVLSTIKQEFRETIPALITRFTLDNAPIVLANDTIPETGGVSFLNTAAQNGSPPFTVTHPAFVSEVIYDVARVPQRPGEYSVNYNTGEVIVFGDDLENDGTGETPPAATYNYRKIFVKDLDYSVDVDRDEISLKSSRDIAGIEAKISFDYEDAFAANVDYRFLSHIEALGERVDNRLVSEFTVRAKNFPITDVFRIFNETTGEIYQLERFNDTDIFFSGRNAPVQRDVERESALFVRVPQEVLLISDELTNTAGLRIFKINLSNNKIMNSSKRFIGSFFDSSVFLSDTDVFVAERFYEDRLFDSVDTNLDRLQAIGEYLIDYNNGIVYVAVSTTQSNDVGDISYEYASIDTRNSHILYVNNIYRSQSSLEENIKNFTIGTVSDETVLVLGIEQIGERFINDNPTRPIIVGSYQSAEDGVTTAGSSSFVSNSANFTSDDVGRTLRLGSNNSPPAQDVSITGIISNTEVLVSPAISDTGKGRVWVVLDLSFGAAKTISLENSIKSINDIYLVEQFGTLTSAQLDGYYDINTDTFSGNLITLADTSALEIGDAVIVDYNYGNIFIDYRYLRDNLIIYYEYGPNSIDWSINNSINEGDEYFVTYKYGALREPLLSNFGALTQIQDITNFPVDFNRETYRDVVGGTLQSFIKGPTIPSIETLVEAFTTVTPEITESVFEGWVLGRDHLNLTKPKSNLTPTYDLGKYDNGVVIREGQSISMPAVSHFSLAEGTLESWIRPDWNGKDSDAKLTFDLTRDGYQDVSQIYIGFNGTNPTSMPFTISKDDADISVLGVPQNFVDDVGFFIWLDEFTNKWQIYWRDIEADGKAYSGTISTEGEFYGIVRPQDSDGYELLEITDLITSRTNSIEFSATVGISENNTTGGFAADGISFGSGKIHYLFDIGQRRDANRISVFKDGRGFLNFQIIDNSAIFNRPLGRFNLATDVSDWVAGALHHIAIAWKLNSPEEKDEMHLFVDGQEVSNLFKYGGDPAIDTSFNFGDVGEETFISSATQAVVGGFDGVSEAGSTLFRSVDVDFEELGVVPGDALNILDENADGTLSVNGLGSGAYTITGVGGNTITIDTTPSSGLTLSLGNIQFSVNQTINTVSTPLNYQDFIVVIRDAYGAETELKGVDAEEPDYSFTRGSDGQHILILNNGVPIGYDVVIKTLGLLFRQCKGKVFVYDTEASQLRFNGPPPVDLVDVDITAIIKSPELIADGYSFNSDFVLSGGTLDATFGSDGYFEGFDDGYLCQPSNTVAGRTLALRLSGDNIDFTGTNTITVNGETAPDTGGTVSFTVIYSFSEAGTIISTDLWKRIDTIEVSVVPVDDTEPAGVFEVREAKPINESEAGGDFAAVASYKNGIIALETYGSGGLPFALNHCQYEIQYPSFLRIHVDGQLGNLVIGADFTGNNTIDAVVDDFRILRVLSTDTRVGETVSQGDRTITTDFEADQQFEDTDETTLLLHFNDNLDISDKYIDAFDEGFISTSSVNANFGRAMRADKDNRGFVIDNSAGVFNNNEGTIEFWVSPLIETRNDPNRRYYVDISSVIVKELESSTKINVILTQRARSIESVRLATDVNNTGINYFTGGSLSNIDAKTITLGTQLPSQNTLVKVSYTSLDSQGDRVSIFKDEESSIVFFMRASGVEYLVSVPVDWQRNTWHRVMAMWKTNSVSGQDRLRLFVDGTEQGTVKYGTGLLYGTGVIYGQAEVRTGVDRFVVDNIDLTDIFAQITIGTNVFGSQNAQSKIDNIRFSEIERLNSIKVVSGENTDVNFTANTSAAEPLSEDVFTNRLIDFNKEIVEITFFADIVNSASGIFRFDLDVIDSFDKVIGNSALEDLLRTLVNTIKPAHTTAIIKFLK